MVKEVTQGRTDKIDVYKTHHMRAAGRTVRETICLEVVVRGHSQGTAWGGGVWELMESHIYSFYQNELVSSHVTVEGWCGKHLGFMGENLVSKTL